MNSKEFKKVLTDAGLNFEIFGYEGILNLISIYLHLDAQQKHEGSALAEYEEENSDKIYKYLQNRGYYNN